MGDKAAKEGESYVWTSLIIVVTHFSQITGRE